MKRFLTLLFIVGSVVCTAQPLVHFRTSKPLGVFTFLQAASRNPHLSPTLTDYIYKHIPAKDTAAFAQIVADFCR